MMKVVYPVIFTEVDTNILIEVPDLEIYTQANDASKKKGSLADAVMMARDVIGLSCISMEDSGKSIPVASKISDIDVKKGAFYEEGESFVSVVDVDLVAYRQKNDMKMVRRNVTLPNWLNLEAEKSHINVSKVLQEALINVLGLTK